MIPDDTLSKKKKLNENGCLRKNNGSFAATCAPLQHHMVCCSLEFLKKWKKDLVRKDRCSLCTKCDGLLSTHLKLRSS